MTRAATTSCSPRARTSGLALLAAGLGLAMVGGSAAHAQRVVPKIGSLCPMGSVDTLNGKFSTLGLMRYTVQPPPPLPGKLTPLHPDHFNHQGA